MAFSLDLISFLRENNGKLNNVKIYGKCVSQLRRPKAIASNTRLSETGIFVKLEVFAVDLSNYTTNLNQYNISNKDNVYFVNGSIVAFIETYNLQLPSWLMLEGCLRFVNNKDTFPYISSFIFKKDKTFDCWSISPNKVTVIDSSLQFKEDELNNYYKQSLEANYVRQPESVTLLPKFYAYNSPIVNIYDESDTFDIKEQNNLIQFHEVLTDSFIPEDRTEIKEYSQVVVKLKEYLVDAFSSLDDFASKVCDKYDFVNKDARLTSFITQIKKNYNNITDGLNGYYLVKSYLQHFSAFDESYLGSTVGDYILSIFEDEITEYILNDKSVFVTGSAYDLVKEAFGNPYKFFAYTLGKIVGVSIEKLDDIVQICDEKNIDFIHILYDNPYMLALLNSNLTYIDVQKLVIALNLNTKESLFSYKYVLRLLDYMYNANGNTYFSTVELLQCKGFDLTDKYLENVLATGTIFDSKTIYTLETYFIEKVGILSETSYDKHNSVWIDIMSKQSFDLTLTNLYKIGLCRMYKGYVIPTFYLYKELYVYDKLYAKGNTLTDLDLSAIDNYITEYENLKGIVFEKEQRDAIHLIKHKAGCITGAAGSGKTTVTDCFVYVLQRLNENIDFRFATPTGKAARRLNEVVKQEVKTMHSMFSVSTSNFSIFRDTQQNIIEDDVTYIFDENAMVTLDLLYSCLTKIGDNSNVYLIGDIYQLPPIGKGVPFKNCLRFLPTVVLKVSKRASDSSNITNVANIVNKHSYSYNWKDVESRDDCLFYDCNEHRIPFVLKDLVLYYDNKLDPDSTEVLYDRFNVDKLPILHNLTLDDIQVITPLNKRKYDWGTEVLNNFLQPLFNATHGVDVTYTHVYSATSKKGLQYVVGDRVIHTNTNMYNMQWYESYKDGVLKKRNGCGINNGEIGKFVGVLKANECTIVESTEDSDYTPPKNIRDDKDWHDSKDYFFVVEYTDYATDTPFYILYRCNTISNINFDSKGTCLIGEDLNKVNLFYAGSIHKMQGSQARLIIMVLGDIDFDGFVTRNMIYTGITRGSDLVLLVGSVSHPNSMFEKARRDISNTNILTVGDLFYDE